MKKDTILRNRKTLASMNKVKEFTPEQHLERSIRFAGEIEDKINTMPEYCKKRYNMFAEEIDKYELNYFAEYLLKSTLHTAITRRGISNEVSFATILHQGSESIANCLTISEEDKITSKKIISDWVRLHNATYFGATIK